jgi:hypothetical protein
MILLKDLDKKEYSEYYTPYLSLLDGESSIESVLVDAIEQTVRIVNSIDKPFSYKYAEGKWSIGQVLQHNLDTERIFAYRALRFMRKDATPLSGFDQDLFVETLGDSAFAKAELLSSMQFTRQATIDLFNNATEDSLQFRGVASGQIMTARVIPFLIAGHSLHHENIIKERYLDN